MRDLATAAVRVGIIGLGATTGWAARAHVPALRALDGYELSGLTASTPAAGRAAAAAHGVPRVFDTARQLIEDPDIDLVVVAVKVPHHRELVLAAVAAGKAVACEWPLGTGLPEARLLASAARRAAVSTLVGLQARSSPLLRRVRDLVAAGGLGTVLSTSVHGGAGGWNGTFNARNEYQLDEANGATLMSIPLAHTLDACTFVLGPVRALNATTATRRPVAVDQQTGRSRPANVADQAAVHGVLADDAVFSIHLRGGVPAGTGFRWEIHGTGGDLALIQDWAHPQFGAVRVEASEQLAKALAASDDDPILRRLPGGEQAEGCNVAHAYAQFRSDLARGSRQAPDFDDAVAHHELIDAIQRAAATGQRQLLAAP